MGNKALTITGLVAGDGNGRPNVIELYGVRGDVSFDYPIFIDTTLRVESGCCSNKPNNITKGEFYTVTDDATAFKSYFGVDATFENENLAKAFAMSGSPAGEVVVQVDDPIGAPSDVFGNKATTSWFYSDGWAYRNDGTTFNGTVGFVEEDWTFAPGVLDKGCPTNDACTCANPFPLGTYNTGTTLSNPPCPPTTTAPPR